MLPHAQLTLWLSRQGLYELHHSTAAQLNNVEQQLSHGHIKPARGLIYMPMLAVQHTDSGVLATHTKHNNLSSTGCAA